MINFIRNRGLELPVYGDERDINFYSGGVGAALPSAGQDTLLRSIIGGEVLARAPNLITALRLADAVFAESAEEVDADVAWHQWGLKKWPSSRLLWQSETIPEGYRLVAEVEVIQNAVLITRQEGRALERQLTSLFGKSKLPWYWTDIKAGQFVDCHSSRNNTDGRWLVDLDLCMAYRQEAQ